MSAEHYRFYVGYKESEMLTLDEIREYLMRDWRLHGLSKRKATRLKQVADRLAWIKNTSQAWVKAP
jgi:hypothetical protein